MNIGSKDLDALRQTASKALIALLWLHVPIAMAVGLAHGTWLMPTILTIVFAAAATVSWQAAGNGLSTSLVVAVALMGGVSVFTYQLAGHALADRHAHVLLRGAGMSRRLLRRPADRSPEPLRSPCTIWLLNFIVPAAIFPGGADFGRVVLHAGILILEAGVLLWVAHQLASAVHDDGAEDRRSRSRQRRRGPRHRRAQSGRASGPAGTRRRHAPARQ